MKDYQTKIVIFAALNDLLIARQNTRQQPAASAGRTGGGRRTATDCRLGRTAGRYRTALMVAIVGMVRMDRTANGRALGLWEVGGPPRD